MSETILTQARRRAPRVDVLPAPRLVLLVAVAALAGLLCLRLTLPVGALYWDLYLYFDAANRILSGQVPGADFFAPVGPLGYALFAAGTKLFPVAQPLLLAQWSLLAVTAPLMALVLADADRRSRGVAIALLVPFLVFSVLPINVEEYSSYPGVDGFGIYNRHGAQLLYVLAAAILFMEAGRRLALVVGVAMLALFLTKITAFVAGGLFCALALPAGRIGWREALLAAIVFLGALLALDVPTGAVRGYLADIAALLAMNEGVLLSRFLQAASIQFLAFGPLALLCLALVAIHGRDLLALARTRPQRLFDHQAVWLGGSVAAALFFETQNTGGQAFLSVWPVLLLVVLRSETLSGGRLALVLCLVAASALPTLGKVVSRGARALVGQMQYVRLDTPALKTLGQVSQRREFMRHAEVMRETYIRFPETYTFIAGRGELPSFTLYADPDYQILWLQTAAEAVTAIRAYEAAEGVRFETIFSLNFTNPFPWLLDRQAPRHVAIGADPSRAVPRPGADVLAAVRATDLVLDPKCPVTAANRDLLALYAPALADHRRITLSPCWDALVRPGLAKG